MKTIKHFAATLLISIVISVTAIAGETNTPGITQPPPSDPPQEISGTSAMSLDDPLNLTLLITVISSPLNLIP